MSTNVTHGYSLVLEVADQVVNDLLPAASLPDVAGENVSLLIGGHTISFDYSLFFPLDPSNQLLYFDTSIPDGVVIRAPFSLGLSHLSIDETHQADVGVNGIITIHHPISAFDNATGERCIGFDFTTLPENHVQVEVTSQSGIPLPSIQLEGYVAGLVRHHLQNNLRTLPFICTTLEADGDPFTPGDLDVRVVNDHCMALLVSSGSATGGDRNAFTDCILDSGSNAALIVSNTTLLRDIACPQLIRVLGLEGEVDDLFVFEDATAVLTTEADLTERLSHALVDRAVMSELHLGIGDNRLDTRATVTVEGRFYRATAVLEAHASISMTEAGDLEVSYGAEVVDTSIFIEPWAWILALVLGPLVPLVGGIIAAVLPILPALINPIFDVILSHVVRGLGGDLHLEIGGLPVQITSINLDDLTCNGRVVRPEPEIPEPGVWLEGVVEAGEGELVEFKEHNLYAKVGLWSMTFAFSHHARYLAKTIRMIFPINFAWRLNGQPLQGAGSVDIDGIPVEYSVDGDRCEFWVASKETLDAYIEVEATAHDGQKCSDSDYAQIEGSTTISGNYGAEIIAGAHWLWGSYGSYLESDSGYAAPPWGFATLAQLGYPAPDEAGQPPG
jgi:hypothetical protein